MLSIRRWIEFSFPNFVMERIASLTASRTFMCQAFSTEDNRSPVVIPWHKAPQLFFGASENMVSSGVLLTKIFIVNFHVAYPPWKLFFGLLVQSKYRFVGYLSVEGNESVISLVKLLELCKSVFSVTLSNLENQTAFHCILRHLKNILSLCLKKK